MTNYQLEGGANKEGKNEKIWLHGRDKQNRKLHRRFFLRRGR